MAAITELARRAAIETLESAFGGRVTRNGHAAGVSRTPGFERRRAGRPSGASSQKRTPGQMQALSERFTKFVRSNPGLRIEQINRQLGTTTRDLALPIRKLLAERVIEAQGKGRSTKYFIAS